MLHELFEIEMKYQAKTLAFIHGLNTYVDWNVTTGLRRGDMAKKIPFKLSHADYDNIFGLNKILDRKHFVELIDKKIETGWT